jgi:hypothetical protein
MKEWENFTQKEWKEYINKLLKENDKALYRSILIIYELQTDTEKILKQTKHQNNIGFGGNDAKFFSELAQKLRKKIHLTETEKAISRNRMAKYWKQLMMVSKGDLKVNIDSKREF